MNKELWKDVLAALPDEEFISLIEKVKVPIPAGFRPSTLRQKIKLVRSRLLATAVTEKYLHKVIDYYDKIAEKSDRYSQYRQQSVEKILSSADGQEALLRASLMLLSSPDKEVQERGESIFYEQYKKEEEQPELVPEQQQQATQPALDKADKNKEVARLEKQVAKAKKQIQELEQALSNLKNSFSYERRKWEREQEQGKQLVNSLNKEIRQQKETLEHAQKEKEQLVEEVASRDELLQEKNAEINRLNALCLTLRTSQQQEVAADQSDEKKVRSGKKVVLIGREVALPEQERYEIEFVHPDEINACVCDPQYEQYWVLTYDTTFRQLREVRKMVDVEKLREFETISVLQNYIAKGEYSK